MTETKKYILTKDEIFKQDDLKVEEVYTPEWQNSFVYIKALPGVLRDELEESMFIGEGLDRKQTMKNLRAKLVCLSLVDGPEGKKRLCSLADAPAMGEKNSKALDRIFDAAQKLNGMRSQDLEEMIDSLRKGQRKNSTSG